MITADELKDALDEFAGDHAEGCPAGDFVNGTCTCGRAAARKTLEALFTRATQKPREGHMLIIYHDERVEIAPRDILAFSAALGIAKRSSEARASAGAMLMVDRAREMWTRLKVWGEVAPR